MLHNPGGGAVKKAEQKTFVCEICGKQKKDSELVPAGSVRESISSIILESVPNWSRDGFICREDLQNFRSKYIKQLLETEKGELDKLELEVLQSVKEHELLSENLNESFEEKIRLGDRLSDRIALFGGSWKFILIFSGVCLVWITLNSIHIVLAKPVDPYPFILLNLMLSCIAALQAPVIMMSQNRQEAKDRLRSEHDYRINLKAELEIRQLHEKLDHLLINQWQRLMDIQELQIDLLEEGNTSNKQGGKP
jgi:uncharacterized membrane protein